MPQAEEAVEDGNPRSSRRGCANFVPEAGGDTRVGGEMGADFTERELASFGDREIVTGL